MNDIDRFNNKAMTVVEALQLIANIAEGSTTANSLPHIAKIAREALAKNVVVDTPTQA